MVANSFPAAKKEQGSKRKRNSPPPPSLLSTEGWHYGMYVGDLGVRALKKSPKSGKCSARDVCARVIGFLKVSVWIGISFCFLFFWPETGGLADVVVIRLGWN